MRPATAAVAWGLGVALGLVALLLPVPGADAASCGGSIPCRCGDTVMASYVLPGDLGPCSGNGLTVRSGVHLNCRGFTIAGLGDGSEQFGIELKGERGSAATRATIAGCRVTRFLRGIRLRGASGNTIQDNVLVGNGNFATHVGYGIDVAGGSTANTLQRNTVRGNADEGVHIGLGSHANQVTDNVITDNHRESLYLLGANGGVFLRNTLGGTGGNSLYLKDSSGNLFEGNRFVDRIARVIGDSRDNRFIDNTFTAGLHFSHYQSDRRPSGNRVVGGTIAGLKECLRFTSSSGNVVADVTLSGCEIQVRGEAPAGPAENTIIGQALGRVSLGDGAVLHQGWRVDVHVQDAAGAPIPGAQVTLSDGAGAPTVAVTDDNGDIPTQVAIGSTRAGTRPPSSVRYTLSTNKPSYATDVRELPVAAHIKLSISLRPER